jgi:DNA-binding NarL/FixJ family response regulator
VSNATLSASIVTDVVSAPKSNLAIVADGQLSVAALEALILVNPAYRVARRARGVVELRRALLTFAPIVVIVESRSAAWRQSLDPVEWSGRTLLLLDPEDDPAQFVQAVHARADGYLSRTTSRQGFAAAIASLRDTGSYLDPILVDRMLRAAKDGLASASAPRHRLSPREHDILIRIADGRSSKDIAREFSIAPKTVCNHINNMYQKLNLRHRGQLVVYAAQHGLADLTAPRPI